MLLTLQSQPFTKRCTSPDAVAPDFCLVPSSDPQQAGRAKRNQQEAVVRYHFVEQTACLRSLGVNIWTPPLLFLRWPRNSLITTEFVHFIQWRIELGNKIINWFYLSRPWEPVLFPETEINSAGNVWVRLFLHRTFVSRLTVKLECLRWAINTSASGQAIHTEGFRGFPQPLQGSLYNRPPPLVSTSLPFPLCKLGHWLKQVARHVTVDISAPSNLPQVVRLWSISERSGSNLSRDTH